MPWVKLDDQFPEHPKVVQAGPLALAMQVAALCYCNRQLTDGFVPAGAVPGLIDVTHVWDRRYPPGSEQDYTWTVTAIVDELIGMGLWVEVTGGYEIHDYLIYQPTREQVEELREQKREAGRLGGLKSGETRRKQKQNGSTVPSTTEANPEAHGEAKIQAKTNPVPVPQPVLESKASGEEESSQRQKRTEIRGNGLPVEKERLVLNLIAAIRKPLEQEEADSLRKYASVLPESALVKAIESVKRKNAADPLKYAFGVLISEKRELAERSLA